MYDPKHLFCTNHLSITRHYSLRTRLRTPHIRVPSQRDPELSQRAECDGPDDKKLSQRPLRELWSAGHMVPEEASGPAYRATALAVKYDSQGVLMSCLPSETKPGIKVH